jgi:hypothetical protein
METFLNEIWNIYFHDPDDENWTNQSYVRLNIFSSVEEFWHNFIPLKENINKGMFFIMRESIFPSWDDSSNINGGCLSIKVLKDHLPNFFEELSVKLVGETLLKEPHRDKWAIINGISTSPKKHFCIIKIWLADTSLASKEYFDIPPKYYGDIIYKLNRDNILNDSLTRVIPATI